MKNKKFILIPILFFISSICFLFGSVCSKTTSFPSIGSIERLDPRLDALLPEDAQLEKLAEGFSWSEGPVWVAKGDYLLFTDIPKNTINKWKEGEGISVYLRPAGYTGDKPSGRELGVNGLALDPNGQLIMCDHGNRCVSRLNEKNYTRKVLVDNYKGKRLNSPNDLVFNSNGDIYFTDPPYGLTGLNDSPVKELDFNGVYRLDTSGELTLLTKELTFPNGIALSPDEKTLYVAQSDNEAPLLKAFPVLEDGTLGEGGLFFDALELKKQGGKGSCDGMAVDKQGNVFATGPGGVLVLNPHGEHLGSILTGQPTANCAFGDDGSVLYITANMYLCRIRTTTRGLGF